MITSAIGQAVKRLEDGKVSAAVTVVDSGVTRDRVFVLNSTLNIDQEIGDLLFKENAAETAANTKTSALPNRVIAIAAKPAVSKTQVETDLADFQAKYALLLAMKRGQAAGLTVVAATVTATTNAATTAWGKAPNNGADWLKYL